MNNYFWDKTEYKCPKCGNDLSIVTSIMTEDLQQQTFKCETCGKIFDITYKLVVDTFTEYREVTKIKFLIGEIYDGSGIMENLQICNDLREALDEINNRVGDNKITDETDWDKDNNTGIMLKNYYISDNCFFIMDFTKIK